MLCLEGDCKIGETLVRQMQAMFRKVVFEPGLEDPQARAINERWGILASNITEEFNTLERQIGRKFPFAIACCQIKELGRQAEKVTQGMAEMADIAAPAPSGIKAPFASGGGLGGIGDLLKWGAIVAGVVILGPPIVRALSKE